MVRYRPQREASEVLTWAKENVIDGLPYTPSARYVFYVVMHEFGFGKKDLKRFEKWTIRARKGFWNGWHPNILSDSIREAKIFGGGYETPSDWFASFREDACLLDKRINQEYYVEIHFEAQAMYGQFEYYTDAYEVPLIPFRGDASIPFKWEIAKRLEDMWERYQKPIMILYFGDWDPKGREIPENAFRDINRWCSARFEFVRCGLTREQVRELDIKENPERPGTYQWEAVKDKDARDIILSNLEEYWNQGAVSERVKEEEEATAKWKESIESVVSELEES
ncbi:MAG: hypothetical protein JSW41_05550 [Candidatus Aenigmatarchaeota archaeon]|nr:MAG: hypothetical protein JSW41_05550 [Candidatus Aenigmarchaeota archaeon]